MTEADIAESFPASKFVAPWGSEMLVNANDYLATPHPDASEIYRIEAAAFASTYRPIAADPAGDR